MTAVLHFLSVAVSDNACDLGFHALREVFDGAVDEGCALAGFVSMDLKSETGKGRKNGLPIPSSNEDGVRTLRCRVRQTVFHLSDSSKVGSTRKRVRCDPGAIVDSFYSHRIGTECFLETFASRWTDCLTLSVIVSESSTQVGIERGRTMLPSSVVPRAKKKMMSLHPPRVNSLDVIPTLVD